MTDDTNQTYLYDEALPIQKADTSQVYTWNSKMYCIYERCIKVKETTEDKIICSLEEDERGVYAFGAILFVQCTNRNYVVNLDSLHICVGYENKWFYLSGKSMFVYDDTCGNQVTFFQ